MFSNLTTNASLKLLSFVIAIFLWFLVLGSKSVEETKEVPIEVITPADLVIANEIPERVAFRLAGPKAFLRNIVNRKDDPIRVNLTASKSGLVTYRFFSDLIQIPLGVKVISINPTAIIAKLEPLKHKEVPVRLVTKGESQSGIKVEHLAMKLNTVKLRGPESRIDQVSEAPTVAFDLSQLKESGEKELALDMTKLPGLLLSGDVPVVQYEVSQQNTSFKIRNVEVKVLTNRKFEIFPKEVAIYVRCSSEELRALTPNKIFGTIDVRDKGPGAYQAAVNVQLPSNIKLIKVLPTQVNVKLF